MIAKADLSSFLSVRSASLVLDVQCLILTVTYFAGGSGYKASVTHYFNSSTEISACAVQPGSEEDLQKIVRLYS